MLKIPSRDNFYKCPICNRKVFKTSHDLHIDKFSKINWISDSSFKLSGLKEANSYLTTCFRCFHSVLVPYYDVSKLYCPRYGLEVRKKIYENYFPNKIYSQKNELININELFSKSAKELKRFYKNLLLINHLYIFEKNDVKDFAILDYGGGDGYISSIYSYVIGTVLNKKVNYCIYDFNDWKNPKGEKFDKKNDLKFQLIILSHILEHNFHPTRIIKDALNYAAEDAIILIEVPDQRYLFLKGLIGGKFGMDYHVSFFSRKSLSRILKKCNIDIFKTIYDPNACYRGQKLETIIAIGRVNKSINNKNKEPSLFYELLSTLFSISIKILRNFKSKVFILKKIF